MKKSIVSLLLLALIFSSSGNLSASSVVWGATYYDENASDWSKTISTNGGTLTYGQNDEYIDEVFSKYKDDSWADYRSVVYKPGTGNYYGGYYENNKTSSISVAFKSGNQKHGSQYR